MAVKQREERPHCHSLSMTNWFKKKMIGKSNHLLYILSQSLPSQMFFQRAGRPGVCGVLLFYTILILPNSLTVNILDFCFNYCFLSV